MVVSITDMFIQLFTHCFGWLGDLMTAAGMMSLWLGCVAVWTAYRFLLKPLFGAAGSDSARKKAAAKSSDE